MTYSQIDLSRGWNVALIFFLLLYFMSPPSFPPFKKKTIWSHNKKENTKATVLKLGWNTVIPIPCCGTNRKLSFDVHTIKWYH